MRNYRASWSVEPIAGMFGVMRVEEWEDRGATAGDRMKRNRIMADGPFVSAVEAARRLDVIVGRAG